MQRVGVLMNDFLWCVLERLKSSDQDVCEQQQPFWTWIMLIEASENLLGQDFAKDGPAEVDGLMVGGNRLFVEELCPVDKKAVDCRM
jgi:hypothetical protein